MSDRLYVNLDLKFLKRTLLKKLPVAFEFIYSIFELIEMNLIKSSLIGIGISSDQIVWHFESSDCWIKQQIAILIHDLTKRTLLKKLPVPILAIDWFNQVGCWTKIDRKLYL